MLREGQIQIDFSTPSFYNTVNAVGSERENLERRAKSGEQLVYELFCSKKVRMAWFEVQSFFQDMNRESLKRSLSVLKKKNKLTKTQFKVMGPEGVECYQYELKPIN